VSFATSQLTGQEPRGARYASRVEWVIGSPDEAKITALQREFGLTRPTALILSARGLSAAQVPGFLDPKLKDLEDPFILPGMERAAERLWEAIKQGEHILVHGDYDTDGITSTVLVEWALRENGAIVTCFLPHRINDGYGLTEDSIEKAVNDGCTLLVTVDCGITSVAAATAAKEHGLDLIITDHHQPGAVLPEAHTLINPKLHPEITTVQMLSGVGVAFKLAHAFIKYGRLHNLGGTELDLKDCLDLVALGTVADIVPLMGENRLMVRHGMQVLTSQRRPGVRALCDLAGLGEHFSASDIAFRLAPRLNAAGRMGNAETALRMLQSENIVDAYNIAAQLDVWNRQRQTFEEQVYASALEQIKLMNLATKRAIVVYGETWHRGVIGIVASRLAQTYHRPSIVLTLESGTEAHGSGRSVEGINLVSALDQCKQYLNRYGGHPMATGLTLNREHLAAFVSTFELAVQDLGGAALAGRRTVTVDGNVGLEELDEAFFNEMEQLQPFGHSHPAPVFRFRRVQGERLAPAGRGHVRGLIRDENGRTLPFIAFGRSLEDLPPSPWDLAATPQMNRYRGTLTPQLQVVDILPAG
jgi:single-stranded-DNA-specific exonuclease